MDPAYTRGVHEVGDGVWAYLQPDGSWGWSNAGLVGSQGAPSLLVDTLFDVPLTAAMLAAFERATPGRIGIVVNTHANGDHCWGNQLFAGARIVASAAAAAEMAELAPSTLAGMLAAAPDLGGLGAYLAWIFGPFDFASVTLTLPTETFTGTLGLDVGGRRVVLHEVGPAHTRGDVIVEVPDASVVFTGDICFNGIHPVMWSGPVGNWIAACDRILAMGPRTVVPGHGPVCGPAAVAELRDYLVWLRNEARARYEAGMTVAEAARDIRLDDYASWGDPERVVVNVATLYREFGATEVPDTVGLLAEMAAFRKGLDN